MNQFMTLLLISFTVAAPSVAQNYPTKSIRIVVPYGPGGSTDVLLRLLAPQLSANLGQPVLIDNRPGGASTIGLNITAQSAPDGYTLGVPNIAFSANPFLFSKLPYNSEKDFMPVSLLTLVPMVMAVHPSVPARSVKELIALAKAKPDSLNYGSAGNGSSNHLATELFKYMTHTKMIHIPYKGGGGAVASLVAGETSLLFATIPSSLQYFKSGRLIGLGISSSKRNPSVPDIPTVAEAGVPGFEALEWQGIVAPAGTHQAIIKRLNQEITKILADPEIKERIEGLGAEVKGGTPEDFAAHIKKEMARWSKVIKAAGIHID